MDETSLSFIKSKVRSFKKPADFTIVTVEADDGAIWLCVYENEIMQYDYNLREEIFVKLEALRLEMEATGLRVFLVGRPGDAPQR